MSGGSALPTVGAIIDWHIHPGIIVASYFVSLIGSITTVELLHRHQSGRGWISWAQQLGIAVSFGLVAIWGMHFVGNRAIIMGDGQPALQLYYNSGYTALSVFLPIIFLFVGFTTVELRQPGQRFFWHMLAACGVCAGLAITGMHYVGNLGISNYKVHNPPGFIIGAAAIAVSASECALSLFFFFKEKWINSLWRRVGCACVLAGAVSGMHWVATSGSSYRLLSVKDHSGTGRNTNLIVAIAISMASCVVCLTFAYLTQRRRKELADRAQHVVLVSATFDQDGRLCVTQEGLLPTQRVTKEYNQRSFSDEFNTAHAVFQWLFRVSSNWEGIADLLPSMKIHLRREANSRNPSLNSTIENRSTSVDSAGEQYYSLLFREQFCVAASELADLLQTQITDLGMLYDGIMPTGTLASLNAVKVKRPSSSSTGFTSIDLESGMKASGSFGKGQALFVVRYADAKESQRLISSGFRFATMDQVGDFIAKSMQVSYSDLSATVAEMREYHGKEEAIPTTGTFLACFCLRPSLKTSHTGWDILVPKQYPFRLPEVELLPSALKSWQAKFLSNLDGLSVSQCTTWLRLRAKETSNPEQSEFASLMLTKITSLSELVNESFFRSAVFTAQAVHAAPNHTSILAFCIIPDVHAASIKSSHKLVYTPLSFFRIRQRTYKNSPDHAMLASKVHAEFGAVLAGCGPELPTASQFGSVGNESHFSMGRRSTRVWRMSKRPFTDSRNPSFALPPPSDTASDHDLVATRSASLSHDTASHAFGGIMVSQNIVVDSQSKDEAQVEMNNLEPKIEGGEGKTEQPTFADELFSITTARWNRP